ncbi:gamma-butyrobetaine hydroxylase-like domain-containing protein [Flocculibacter collagenilyticus]|uniref:gamma-butyrobetaine hydroxylase-like domain-containing protein n=1 Tax=Flocculibacter collagenilyticus TaxID=2744479 RepID=UPI0018F7CACB|nr:gamma-butyrobetaine hydroxylase-like domain-containing protein [Flocculibacter collagenilyticus]
MTSSSTPTSTQLPPITKLHYHQVSKTLDIYINHEVVNLTAEFLRVHSPSAEVRGHGATEHKLVMNKQHVAIDALVYVGNYAVKLMFDDGHDSGIYSWRYLAELAENHETLWSEYKHKVAEKLKQVKVSHEQVISTKPPSH